SSRVDSCGGCGESRAREGHVGSSPAGAVPGYFLEHLPTRGYHPRSDKHSQAGADSIVIDLMAHCPKISAAGRAESLVFEYNVELVHGHSRWKTDLAIGPPAPGAVSAGSDRVAGMARSIPTWTRVAVEAKTVMTKHTGARKNRKRDLEAHHQHVHDYDATAV